MKRFSDEFGLGLTQGSLDFVNIDVVGDSPGYIDAHSIRTQKGDWVEACQPSIATYFDSLLDAIRDCNELRLRALVIPLTEPNETHLGQSIGESRGRSLGSEKRAQDLISAL